VRRIGREPVCYLRSGWTPGTVGLSAGGRGALAQLVERLHGMQEVRGSNPLSSTRSEACETQFKIIGEQVGEQAARYP
jgi:hypothetical protein